MEQNYGGDDANNTNPIFDCLISKASLGDLISIEKNLEYLGGPDIHPDLICHFSTLREPNYPWRSDPQMISPPCWVRTSIEVGNNPEIFIVSNIFKKKPTSVRLIPSGINSGNAEIKVRMTGIEVQRLRDLKLFHFFADQFENRYGVFKFYLNGVCIP